MHGTPGNMGDMAVALGARLAGKGFRVLAVDRPGNGWSDRVAGVAREKAAKIRQAVESLGDREAIVVAHSLGAVTALALAVDSPGFVRGLVLIAPVTNPWSGPVRWYYPLCANPVIGPALRRTVVLPLGFAFLRKAIAGLFAPSPPPPGFASSTRVTLALRPLTFRYHAEDVVRALATVTKLSPFYGGIRAPTEIVAGECDTTIPPDVHAKVCARAIPGARLTMLPNVGHAVHHVVPDLIVERVLALRDDRAPEAAVDVATVGSGSLPAPASA